MDEIPQDVPCEVIDVSDLSPTEVIGLGDGVLGQMIDRIVGGPAHQDDYSSPFGSSL